MLPAAAHRQSLAGSCTLNLPAGTSDDDAISAVIHAEGQLVVDQKIDALMALWTDGASITNAKNTPDAAEDDQYLARQGCHPPPLCAHGLPRCTQAGFARRPEDHP